MYMMILRLSMPRSLSARRVAARIPRIFAVFRAISVFFHREEVNTLCQSTDSYTESFPSVIDHMVDNFWDRFGSQRVELGRVGGDGVRKSGRDETLKSRE